MLRLTSLTAAAIVVSFGAFAADLPRRTVKPSPPVASTACLETSAVPTDIFGITTGSDVSDVGAYAANASYTGGFGVFGGRLSNHFIRAQVATAFIPCFEVGPSVSGAFQRTSFPGGGKFDFDQGGGSVEMKYKLLGRSVHGIGLTVTAEPFVAYRDYNFGFGAGQDGTVFSNLTRVLLDAELIKDTLYGAINLEHLGGWDEAVTINSAYFRASNLNLRAALSYKLTETFYLGIEAAHQRAYAGIFANRELGYANFVGPNFYWQATPKLSINGSLQFQVYGQAKGACPVQPSELPRVVGPCRGGTTPSWPSRRQSFARGVRTYASPPARGSVGYAPPRSRQNLAPPQPVIRSPEIFDMMALKTAPICCASCTR